MVASSMVFAKARNQVKRISCQRCDFKALDLQELSSHIINLHLVPIPSMKNKPTIMSEKETVWKTKEMPKSTHTSQEEHLKSSSYFNHHKYSFVGDSQLDGEQDYKQTLVLNHVQAPARNCDRCNFSTVDQCQFEGHIKIHHQNDGHLLKAQSLSTSYITDLKPQKHPDPMQAYATNHSLKVPTEKSPKVFQYCPHCDFSTSYALQFEAHMFNKHAAAGLNKIRHNQLVFQRNLSSQAEASIVPNPTSSHEIKVQFNRNLISTTNNVMSNIENKLPIHKSTNIKVIQPAEYYMKAIDCAHCKFKTMNEKTFQTHMWRFHPALIPKTVKETKPHLQTKDNFYTYFNCAKCSYKSLLADNLIDHISKKHSDKPQTPQKSIEEMQNGDFPPKLSSKAYDMPEVIPIVAQPNTSYQNQSLLQQQQNEPDEMVCSKCFNYSSTNIAQMAMHFMSCTQDKIQENYNTNLIPEVTTKEMPFTEIKGLVITKEIINCSKCSKFQTNSMKQLTIHSKQCQGNTEEQSINYKVQENYNINLRPEVPFKDIPFQETKCLVKTKKIISCSMCSNFQTNSMEQLNIHFKQCQGNKEDMFGNFKIQNNYNINAIPEVTVIEMPSQETTSLVKTKKMVNCSKCFNFQTNKMKELNIHFKKCQAFKDNTEQSLPKGDNNIRESDMGLTCQPVNSNNIQPDHINKAVDVGNNVKPQPQKKKLCSKCHNFKTTNFSELANHFKVCNSTQNEQQAESKSLKQENLISKETVCSSAPKENSQDSEECVSQSNQTLPTVEIKPKDESSLESESNLPKNFGNIVCSNCHKISFSRPNKLAQHYMICKLVNSSQLIKGTNDNRENEVLKSLVIKASEQLQVKPTETEESDKNNIGSNFTNTSSLNKTSQLKMKCKNCEFKSNKRVQLAIHYKTCNNL